MLAHQRGLVAAFLIAGVTAVLAVSSSVAARGALTIEALRSEPEILALHYKSPPLEMTTRAEARSDSDDEDPLDEAPLWVQILFSGDAEPEDPDAESAETIESLWDDPVVEVKETFLASLQSQLGFENVLPRERAVRRKDHKVKRLKTRFEGTTILDFMTTAVDLDPKADSGRRYHLTYGVRARLIMAASGVAWNETCHKTGSAHRLESFAKNDGELLRKQLSELSNACGKRLFSSFSDRIRSENNRK